MKQRNQKWKTARLGDYVDVQTGFPFKSKEYIDDSSGVRLLRGDNIVQGKLRWEGVKRWPRADAGNFDKYSLQADDVVLAMDRPWIEAGLKYAWITERDLPCLLVQRVSRLRGRNGLLTPYIRYLIGHHSFTDYVKGIWTGIAVPHISESQIRAFEFQLPPVDIQSRVLNILTTYDDLIQNNARRIKILEEMAQMIYREWFVNFRFPGHEKVRMVKSELGPMPERWSIVSFDEISDILSGGTPKTTEPAYWNGPIPFFGPTDAPEISYVISTSKSITELGLSRCNSKLYPAETVFITARGTVGKVALPASAMAMNQSCYALRGKAGINQLALFLITKDCARHLKQKSHGAVFDTITVETFQKLRLVRPPNGLLAALEATVRPMFGLVLTLLRSTANLRATRDLLLPKLISGEIPVEAVAKAARELVAQPA